MQNGLAFRDSPIIPFRHSPNIKCIFLQGKTPELILAAPCDLSMWESSFSSSSSAAVAAGCDARDRSVVESWPLNVQLLRSNRRTNGLWLQESRPAPRSSFLPLLDLWLCVLNESPDVFWKEWGKNHVRLLRNIFYSIVWITIKYTGRLKRKICLRVHRCCI